tara:strand:+ start:3278 stop:4396 length:1119 start_codon:yes stop_codon:yes gene_type:complete
MIPLLKPKLPNWSQLEDYISESEYCAHYSNFGPCHGKLINKLSIHYSIDSRSICLFSSATLALSLIILYYKQLSVSRQFTVALPSWTFAASAQAVKSVGADILFFDTDNSGYLNIDALEEACKENNKLIDAILFVVPFGSSYDSYLERLKYLQEKYNKPVIIDCAAGFSSLLSSNLPTVVSTHATKFMPTAEGGFLVCEDFDLISRLKASTNFGFSGSRESSVLGTNAKMSEYHAALGLAFMKNYLSDRINTYKAQFSEYSRLIELYCSKSASIFLNSINYPVSTFNIRLSESDQLSIDELSIRLMRDHGIETRRWWNLPLHMHSAFCDVHCYGELQNTHLLHQSVFAIPFGSHLNPQLQEFIISSLAKCIS